MSEYPLLMSLKGHGSWNRLISHTENHCPCQARSNNHDRAVDLIAMRIHRMDLRILFQKVVPLAARNEENQTMCPRIRLPPGLWKRKRVMWMMKWTRILLLWMATTWLWKTPQVSKANRTRYKSFPMMGLYSLVILTLSLPLGMISQYWQLGISNKDDWWQHRQNGNVIMWTIHPRGENRIEEQHISLPNNTSGDVTCLCWHVYLFITDSTNNSQMTLYWQQVRSSDSRRYGTLMVPFALLSLHNVDQSSISSSTHQDHF